MGKKMGTGGHKNHKLCNAQMCVISLESSVVSNLNVVNSGKHLQIPTKNFLWQFVISLGYKIDQKSITFFEISKT